VSVYLDPAQTGIAWMLDPDSDELALLSREAESRAPESPCDGRVLARDAGALLELLRERHFGIATGVVDEKAAAAAVGAWAGRVESARTWGEAVTELQFDLRSALGDQHVRLYGAPRWRDGRSEVEHTGPAVEERVVDGVLVIVVRRLLGDPADEALLAAWVADADRHFAFDRIVLDVRGNPGGNDGHTYDWAKRRFRHVAEHSHEGNWTVRGKPFGNWNAAAWRAARDGGVDLVPPHLVAGRHDPRPGDVLEVTEESWELPGGDLDWDGRLVVLTDRRTRSSGESSAWFLRDGLGATIAGQPSTGMIEFGNVVPYALPESGLAINLPTKHNDYGFPVEFAGFPVDVPLDPDLPVEHIAAEFDAIVAR
jgi:hypothetical protein